jgi:hypothetical protein
MNFMDRFLVYGRDFWPLVMRPNAHNSCVKVYANILPEDIRAHA